MTVSDRITKVQRHSPVHQGFLIRCKRLQHILIHSELFRGINTILAGYAQVYFSKKSIPGLFFCLATFVVPVIGLAGLSGLLLATLFAKMMGFIRSTDDGTFYAYNGLLTALALALTYTMNLPCFAMLIIAMFLCVLVASALRNLFEKYLFIPVLSLPFIITTWIIIAAGKKFSGLIYTTTPFEIELLNGVFPDSAEFLFRSLGAAFFQLSVPSGLLVATGLLISSRHAFIVSSLALFFASYFHMATGGSMSDLNGQWIGFNFALTAIAVGGMFVVPGIGSYALALMSALISSVVAAASLMMFEASGMPVLALPFVFTTMIILYPLRNRISPMYLKSITTPKESPEANLKYHKNPRARFVADETPAFHLPVSGKWTITQGFNGDETHQDLWSHALDFEVTDDTGQTWKNEGNQLTDYYAWNMPVFAPADGVVTKVINSIDDNRIGQVNTKNNWGNTIIIWHYGSVYSSMSHLAKDSICVAEGDTIQKGKVVGKTGNSGRSPFPHLHFQVQLSPELGAHTIPFHILNYLTCNNQLSEYTLCSVPEKNEIIEAVQPDTGMIDAASFPVGGNWEFDITSGQKQWKETWESEIDFLGNRFLSCNETGASLNFYVNGYVLLFIDYKGPSGTALEWLFLAASCLPFTRQPIQRTESLPPETLLKPVQRLLFDCLEPIYDSAALQASIQYHTAGSDLYSLSTRLIMFRKLVPGKPSVRHIKTTFSKQRGLISLTGGASDTVLFQLTQRGLS